MSVASEELLGEVVDIPLALRNQLFEIGYGNYSYEPWTRAELLDELARDLEDEGYDRDAIEAVALGDEPSMLIYVARRHRAIRDLHPRDGAIASLQLEDELRGEKVPLVRRRDRSAVKDAYDAGRGHARGEIERALKAAKPAIAAAPAKALTPADALVQQLCLTPEEIERQGMLATAAYCGGDFEFAALLDKAAHAMRPHYQAYVSWLEKGEAAEVGEQRAMGETVEMLDAREVRETEWLARNLITRTGLGAIGAEPKISKTWNAVDIAVSVASGTAAFGAHPVDRRGSVFYFFAEDGEGSVKSRVHAVARGKGLTDDSWRRRLTVQSAGRTIDLTRQVDVLNLVASAWLAERRGGEPLGLVVLDPMSDVHSGDENDRKGMAPLMQLLRGIRDVLGCAILMVHHSSKTNADAKVQKRGGQKLRGSSAIHGALDFGIYLDNPRGDRKTEFINRVETEVKSGRGGGKFDMTLTIEDDERGFAIKATHVTGECADPAKDATAVDELYASVVMRLFKQGSPMTRDDLKRVLRCGSDNLKAALEHAVKDELIAHRSRNQGGGYVITELGRRWVRDGESAPGTADAPLAYS